MRLELARAFDAAPPSWSVTLHEEPPADADVVVCGPDRQVDGAIDFDPADPDQLLESIRARISTPHQRPIVVVSATGGCGATSIALHLGAISGGCLIEASGTDVRRRLVMSSAKSWEPALQHEPLELCALPVAPGFRVLLSPEEGHDDDLRIIVERSCSAFGHVVVDCGAERLPDLLSCGGIGVMVFTPTRPSAERARDIVSGYPSVKWAMVANRLGPGSGLTRASIEAILRRRVALELPCSAGLRDAEDEGRLLTSSLSPWVWQMKRLWRALSTA